MEEFPNNRIEEYPRVPANRLGLWLLTPLVLGVIVIFILSIEWKESLKIEHVIVQGAGIVPAQDVYGWAKVELKSPMYGVKLSEVQDRLIAHPFLGSVTVSRQLPDAFRIQVVERVPIASLSAGIMQYVDAEGVLLPAMQFPVKLDLPIISGVSGVERFRPGDIITSNELFEAIEILRTAQGIDSSMYRFLSEVNMNGGGDIILYSNDVVVPILVGRGDIGKKLAMLRAFWSSFVKTNDSRRLQYIDLRYDDQVVVKWNHQS